LKDRVFHCGAAAKGVANATLCAGLLLGSLQLHAAIPHAQVSGKPLTTIANDFARLANGQPRKCIHQNEPEPSVRGWRKSSSQCAWQNRLQMQRWEAGKGSDPKSCLSPPALWWAWARSSVAPTSGNIAWNDGWATQSLIDDASTQRRVAIIERSKDGSWVATEWRWSPSPRAATRKWQEGRWKLLTDAAMQIRQPEFTELVLSETVQLRTAWEKNLAGSAAEVSARSWLWQRDDLCMRMETVGISQAQLHLPYSTEDGRLEQRAAMQLRLVRTFPKAIWLTPFRQLPLHGSTIRGGAKYEAIWIENGAVRGQLWIPTKGDGAVLRARIVVEMPMERGSQTTSAALVANIANSINRELIGLATIWAYDNER
jgi:hypothetical protein